MSIDFDLKSKVFNILTYHFFGRLKTEKNKTETIENAYLYKLHGKLIDYTERSYKCVKIIIFE